MSRSGGGQDRFASLSFFGPFVIDGKRIAVKSQVNNYG